MSYDDEVRGDQNWKMCKVCGIDYLDECPSCNPRTLYHVGVGSPDGPDDFEIVDCDCGCPEFWDKQEAISHAKSLVTGPDQLVVVHDSNGKEVWANA